jgi:hypothetical protein
MMRPYDRLSEDEKQIDRDSVLGYAKRLATVGYWIIWLEEADPGHAPPA